MEDLKNIRHFEEFKDAVNEELLWGAVKNLLSTIFGKMDKKFADSINNFTKKIDGTKTWEEAVKFMEQADGDVKNKMTEGLKTVTGPLGLRKLLVDVSDTVFTELMVLFNRYGQKEATPRKIFEGTPNAQMFAFDKAKDFKAALANSLNAKIIEMNKGQNGQQPAYDENELKTYLEKQTNIDAVDPQQPAAPAPTEPNQKDKNATIASSGGDHVPEKFRYLNEEYEYDANGNPVSTRNKTATPPAEGAKPAATPAEGAKPAATPPAKTDPNAPPKGTIANLTAPATAWVNEQLLGASLKKLQGLKPPSKVGQEDAFTAVTKNTKVTQNKESVAKLLRGITNLPEDKKPELIQIRDILGKATGKTPDEMKNDIPL